MKRQMKKSAKRSLWQCLLLVVLLLMMSMTTWAADRNARINSVKITVSDY